MKNEKENIGGSFLDLFEVNHSKFSTQTEEVISNVDEVETLGGIDDKDTPELVPEVITTLETTIEEDYNDIDQIVNGLVSSNTLLFSEDKEYESSLGGLKELINETVDKRNEEFISTYKSSLGKEAEELLNMLSGGGTVADYIASTEEVDFTKVPLTDDRGIDLENNQINLVQDWLEVQGYSEDDIKETIEDYRSGGLLYKQAEIAKKRLAIWQTDQRKEKEQEKEQAIIKQKEEDISSAKEFEKEVTSLNEIAGFSISKDKAIKLHDFITKKDSSGKTQFQQKDSQENRLLYAFMAMEGFNKDKLVKEVVTKQAIKLKKDLSNYTDSAVSPKRGDAVTYEKTKDIVSGIKWMGL